MAQRTKAQQPPADQITLTINTFASLETDDYDSEIDNTLEHLNGWAHKVQVMKPRSSQKSRIASSKKPKARALITCEAGLNAVDKKIIARLPDWKSYGRGDEEMPQQRVAWS